MYPYKDEMPILGIYGKCMTQTKSMNHTNIQTGIKKTYIKTCILSKKRNAYSISHGFIFKVNKKTYYVKSIKIKNSYQQSLSHKF